MLLSRRRPLSYSYYELSNHPSLAGSPFPLSPSGHIESPTEDAHGAFAVKDLRRHEMSVCAREGRSDRIGSEGAFIDLKPSRRRGNVWPWTSCESMVGLLALASADELFPPGDE